MPRTTGVLLLLLVSGFAPSSTANAASPRPNILFIMSDDHCSQAVGAYNSRLAGLNPTPVIDTLAAEGVLFENCFVTNSICTPSRACIISGQYNHINGVLTLGGRITPENQHLAIEMRACGYETAMIGKWHLKEEPNFDYYNVLPGQGSYTNPTFKEKTAGSWPDNVIQKEGHSSDCITDISLSWLKRRNRDKPFFLMHHFKAPHDIFINAPRYDSYLEDTEIPEPPSMWSQPKFGSIATRGVDDELLPYIGTSISARNPRRNYIKLWAKDPDLSPEAATRLAYQTYMKKYLRCVKGVDDNLGRLFAHLKAEGLWDNTVIIYTGDQGFMLGEHDYMDKRWMYDPSQRMPLLVRYPKSIPAGTRTDAIVENVDFAATMLDFASVATPDYMQGSSLRTICETGMEPTGWKQAAYYRYWMHMAHHDNPSHFGIRTKQHKLIFYYGCGMQGEQQTPPGWELYDLDRDPHEVNNVYDNPEYAQVVERLKTQLAERRTEIGDTDEEFPEIAAVVDEFWDYDAEDRAKAAEISHRYAEQMKAKTTQTADKNRREAGAKPVNLKPDQYIEPAPSTAPLRTHGKLTEISRNATYKVSHPGSGSFNIDYQHLLSGDPPSIKSHAFHSAIDAIGPHITIRLEKPSRVSALRIINRQGSLHERAAGLTVWLSPDEHQWQQVWVADTIAAQWLATWGRPIQCQHIKIGLPQIGTLHLNQVVVFGE